MLWDHSVLHKLIDRHKFSRDVLNWDRLTANNCIYLPIYWSDGSMWRLIITETNVSFIDTVNIVARVVTVMQMSRTETDAL